jgi:hypothetical protein
MEGKKTGRCKRVLGKANPGVTVLLGHEWRKSRKLVLIRTADGLASCREARGKGLP